MSENITVTVNDAQYVVEFTDTHLFIRCGSDQETIFLDSGEMSDSCHERYHSQAQALCSYYLAQTKLLYEAFSRSSV